MIEPDHPRISTARQCRLLGLPRSTYYHRPLPTPKEDLALMRKIDEVYMAHPYFGSRQMARFLRRQGYRVNRKRIRRLMRLMDMEAIYQKPNLSRPHPEHRVYPYLLRNLTVNRPNYVWLSTTIVSQTNDN
jgi:putative transposase